MRARAHAVQTKDLEIALDPGQQVENAICEAVAAAGCDGAWVDMTGLRAAPFAFVMPAPSPDGTRVAWYSETYTPTGVARVDMGGMSVGHHKGDAFTHCHGIWTSEEGRTLGHMLAPRCTVSHPVILNAIGFNGARFERQADDETCFELFRAVPASTPAQDADAVLLTLSPNTDLCREIERASHEHGIKNASVHGLGSVNGAQFIDAPPMHSAITEFIISAGTLSNGKARIALSAVDIEKDIYAGTVDAGGAPISITAEILIRKQA
jgi:predicted DNA-binding protein with PD1-like motif